MLLTGRKLVGGTSSRRKSWAQAPRTESRGRAEPRSAPPVRTRTSTTRTSTRPSCASGSRRADSYKLYYSGNTVDANSSFHTRVGLATSNNGSSFNKVNRSQTGDAILDVGSLGTAFDARQASGLSVAPSGATPKLVGFYWGTRGSDFKPRLGEATSPDGTGWTKVSVSAPDGGALFPLGNPASFDHVARRDPHVMNDSTTFHLYFTALNSSGTRSIGYAATSRTACPSCRTTVCGRPAASCWPSRRRLRLRHKRCRASVRPQGWRELRHVLHEVRFEWKREDRAGHAASAAGLSPAMPAVVDVGAAAKLRRRLGQDPSSSRRASATACCTPASRPSKARRSSGSGTRPRRTECLDQRGVVLDPSLTAYGYDEVGVEPAGVLSTARRCTSGRAASTAGRTQRSCHDGISDSRCRAGGSPERLGDLPARRRVDHEPRFPPDRPYLDRQLRRTLGQLPPALFVERQRVLVRLLPRHCGEPDRGVELPAHRPGGSLAGAPLRDRAETRRSRGADHARAGQLLPGRRRVELDRAVAGSRRHCLAGLTATMNVFSGGGGSASANARLLDAVTGEQVAAAPVSAGETTVDLTEVNAAAHQSLRSASSSSRRTVRRRRGSVPSVSLQTAPPRPPPPPPPPVPPAATLVAAPGRSSSGCIRRCRARSRALERHSCGQVVTLAAQPIGAAAFLPTDRHYRRGRQLPPSSSSRRSGRYRASLAGAASEPTVVVAVKHLITLRALRRSGKLCVAPSRPPRRVVVIQKRRGTRWVTIARVRTSRRSTFSSSEGDQHAVAVQEPHCGGSRASREPPAASYAGRSRSHVASLPFGGWIDYRGNRRTPVGAFGVKEVSMRRTHRGTCSSSRCSSCLPRPRAAGRQRASTNVVASTPFKGGGYAGYAPGATAPTPGSYGSATTTPTCPSRGSPCSRGPRPGRNIEGVLREVQHLLQLPPRLAHDHQRRAASEHRPGLVRHDGLEMPPSWTNNTDPNVDFDSQVEPYERRSVQRLLGESAA